MLRPFTICVRGFFMKMMENIFHFIKYKFIIIYRFCQSRNNVLVVYMHMRPRPGLQLMVVLLGLLCSEYEWSVCRRREVHYRRKIQFKFLTGAQYINLVLNIM